MKDKAADELETALVRAERMLSIVVDMAPGGTLILTDVQVNNFKEVRDSITAIRRGRKAVVK